MKIGAEEKKKVIIMAVLLVVAVPLLIHSYTSFHPSTPSAPAAAPKPPTPTPPRAAQKKTGIPQVREGTLDPTLRTDILAASQKIEYTGGKRNIFKVAEPPIQKLPDFNQGVKITPQPPPVVETPKPQIPLIYYGFSNRPGEPKKAFLRDREDIYVAVEGDVVERRYKILKITNTSVVVEDVLGNYQQTIALTLPQSS